IVPVTAYDMERNEGATRLWLQPLDGGPARVLTAEDATSTEPRPSPDGRRIAFVRRKGKEKPQLHVLPLDGGEAERLTDLPLGVRDPRWFPDGRLIAFLAGVLADAPTPEGTRELLARREADPVKARTTEDRVYRYWDRWLLDGEVLHLFVLDLETGAMRDLLPDSRRHFDFMDPSGTYDISPDGKEIAFSANGTAAPYPALRDDVFTVPTAGGDVVCWTSDNPGDDVRPRYSPDGRSILFRTQRVPHHHGDRFRLARIDRVTGRSDVLTEDWDRSILDFASSPDGKRVAVVVEDRGRAHLEVVDLERAGAERVSLAAGGTISHPVWSGDRILFLREDLRSPPDVWSAALGSEATQVTRWNDVRLQDLSLGEVREIEVPGAGGVPIQVFVVVPSGFDETSKWPLVMVVHGGPHGTFGDQFHFRWNAQLFASPGYVVAMPNFHGSTSFGQAFTDSIQGAHGDRPFTDVMAATDALVATGFVDEERMAVAGGSYGGYLVTWIAGHTDRFRCLVNHAGVYDTLSQYASDVTHGRDRAYGGEPWTDLAAIDRWNPARFTAGMTTPMLVLHGENDFRVPVTQAYEVYGVLEAKGVPARLVIYPDENHWVLKPRNSRHWYGEVLSWLERYLKPSR
ncbi:MAG: S9 family peptidase, partial [Actinobacteria bacterium]|nr:S9 family peptidase [Actinomycetota bacterium]